MMGGDRSGATRGGVPGESGCQAPTDDIDGDGPGAPPQAMKPTALRRRLVAVLDAQPMATRPFPAIARDECYHAGSHVR